jgi:hypothetical protein
MMNKDMLTPEKKEIYTSTIEDERSTIYLDHNGEVIEIERHDPVVREPLTKEEVAQTIIPDVSTKPLTPEEVDRILNGESK